MKHQRVSDGGRPGNLLRAKFSHEHPVWETRRFLFPEQASKEGPGRSRPLRWGLNLGFTLFGRHHLSSLQRKDVILPFGLEPEKNLEIDAHFPIQYAEGCWLYSSV